MLTLEELYKLDEWAIIYPNVPRTRLVNARQGYSFYGAVAMSLEEWDRRGEIEIGDDTLDRLGISRSLSEGDEIEIGGIHLLAFEREFAHRSWVFLDANQPENHRRFMWRLELDSRYHCLFELLWILRDQTAWLWPDMVRYDGLL